jgi:proteasome lid subunit RPN8/RPN11
VIALDAAAAAKIRAHGRVAYPEECCGALLGTRAGEVARVAVVRAIVNARDDERGRRFLVAPSEYLAAEREAAARGLEVLGFYHSHPDQPAVPSTFDRLHAWPNLHYLILGIAAGEPRELTSWLLAEDRAEMRGEPLLLDGEE